MKRKNLKLVLAISFLVFMNLSGFVEVVKLVALKFHSTTTFIESEGNGRIAIKLIEPENPRYGSETSILLSIGAFLTPGAMNDFKFELPVVENGLVSASFLWPGCSDRLENVKSEGDFDYGGKNCIKALSDVILFLAGNKKDVYGRSVGENLNVEVRTEDLGLHAFSHPGIAFVQLMANYPQSIKYVSYFVGGENPTVDKITAVEAGHYLQEGERRIPLENPLYRYPGSYNLNDIKIDYSSIKYDAASGFPYFDLNSDGIYDSDDLILEKRRPSIYGKYVYSYDLLSSLVKNGELRLSDWPSDWATPDQAKEWWQDRSTANQFEKIGEFKYGLKVMLVFGQLDHVQTARDKPHIHQMYEGFKDYAGIGWIRLNPDSSYINSFAVGKPLKFLEHDANSSPKDWMEIVKWSVPNSMHVSMAVVAGILEMADRTHFNNWSPDITGILR